MNQPGKSFAELREEARLRASTTFTRRELAQVALLKDAHQEKIVPILAKCSVRHLGGGEVLVRAGTSCDALYLVLSGRLRLHDPSSTVPDSYLKAGDSVGELILLHAATIAWTITAAEPTRLLVIDQKVAWYLIQTSHEVARNWLARLAERARMGGIIPGNEELKASYKRHATLDETTGLHNRVWLEMMLPRQTTRSAMSNSPLSLLLIEIDDFPQYCSQFGVDAGEHARYAVAQSLANNVRPTDLVACYGHASFAVVLPEADVSGAAIVGERIRHAVSEAIVMMSDESILPPVTVSVGAAQFQSAYDAPAFLAAGEKAVESAKAVGGNRVGMQGG